MKKNHRLERHSHTHPTERTLVSNSGTVATVQAWDGALRHLQTSEEGRRALTLLRVCAYMAADNIPKALLLAYLKEVYPTSEPESYLHSMLNLLHPHALVREQGDTLCMDQALQKVVVQQNPMNYLVYEILAKICHAEFNRETQAHENEARQEALLPHLQRFTEHYQPDWDSHQGTILWHAMLLYDMGSVFYDLGNYKAAQDALEKALAIEEHVYGPEHAEVAQTLTKLGSVYGSFKNFIKAKECLKRALAIQMRVYGPEHAEIVAFLSNLGNAHAAFGEYADAKNLLERALAIQTRVYGPEHPRVALILMNLGNAHAALGKYADAKNLLERALAIQTRVYGPEHAEIATTLMNIGNVYNALKDYDSAKKVLEQALAIKERAYDDPQHIDLAPTLMNLGYALKFLGKTADSQNYFKQAYNIFLNWNGIEDPRTQSALHEVCHGEGGILMLHQYAHQPRQTEKLASRSQYYRQPSR